MTHYFSFRNSLMLLLLITTLLFVNSCKTSGTDEELRQIIKEIESKVIPLQTKINMAEYKAALSGKDADYKKAAKLNIELTEIYSQKDTYRKLKVFVANKKVEDPLLLREAQLYFNEYRFHQVETQKMAQMIRWAFDAEKKFSVYRAELGEKKLTDTEISDILQNSRDNKELEQVWKASKQVGNLIVDDLLKLVKMRNEAAKSIGFANYYEMRLTLRGQNPKEIQQLFDELDLLTRKPYAQLKYDMDDYLAELYGLKVEDLRPWHYQNVYFQQAPEIYKINWNKYYADKNVIEIGKEYFKGIDLDISALVARSDLEGRKGKTQFSGTFDIDRKGDVRVIGNISSNQNSMYEMLYEFGEAIYDANIDPNLPYSLRVPAGFFITDAVANFFGSLSSNPVWLAEMLKISKEEKEAIIESAKKANRLEKFVFSRWSQVMYRFEKSMYENPSQNLNKLWWDLVEKYQLIRRPDNWDNPDWASKGHIITKPCTYHNYMLGELFCAQLNTYIIENIAEKNKDNEISYCNNPAIGAFLKEKIFRPGSKQTWQEVIKQATGEELSPDFFKNRIIY